MINNFHSKTSLQVSHVTLLVQNLQKQIDFYKNFLGLIVIGETSGTAILSANGTTPLVQLKTTEGVLPKQNNLGLYHFALLFATDSALADVFYNLLTKKYAFTGFSDHGVSKALYLNDPEGNGIELYSDRITSEWPQENGKLTMYTLPLDYQLLLQQVKQPQFTKIDSQTVMGHLHLHVNSLTVAHDFFVNVIGFNTTLNYGNSAEFISSSGYHHHMGLNTWLPHAVEKPENVAGLLGYTISAPEELFKNILSNINSKNLTTTITKDSIIIKDINNTTVTIEKIV